MQDSATMKKINLLPFANVPCSAEGHFRLHFYAVVARLLAHLHAAGLDEKKDNGFEQFSFLAGYRAALQSYHPTAATGPSPAIEGAWWDTQIAAWESQIDGHLPLRVLVDEVGLSREAVRLLIAVGLVEEDIRFGALFAALQEPLAARRPCIGVLGWLLSDTDGMPGDAWPTCRTLLDLGFLLVENRADPRAEWLLRVPPSIWDALCGRPFARPAPGLALQRASDFPPLDHLILPDALQSQIMQVPELLRSGQITALAIRGMAGSGRRTLLGAVARAVGTRTLSGHPHPHPVRGTGKRGTGNEGIIASRDVLLWEEGKPGDDTWRLLGPLATLTGAMPVLRCDPGPGETLDLPALPSYLGPVGITLGRSGGLRGPLIAHSLSLNLPPPDRKARLRFWQATTVPVQPTVLDEIVTRFLLTGGHIHRTASLSQAYATLENRQQITLSDVQQATRALNRQALETLATPLEPTNGFVDLVVGAATSHELQSLQARCHRREVLREHAGPAFSHNLTRGVRAMFSGPSGTGKTLAARVLAATLQMDLYRVDLAAVVNKYIGETERNLNQVLSRAEELDVMLLLDEGDALMTKRTEVRNANDRYANLETNYLLQRLENYEGIVVITTNAGNRIDTAFLRRLDVIINFASPEAPERWQIWQSHLPAAHAISPTFLEEVATRCALTGGQMRNAALHATLLSLGDSGQVRDAHLEAALQREYRKAGAAYPLSPKVATRSQVDRLRQLAADLGS
ncbi:MAG: ATP-binding protein [Ktedonobacteraceae bacterium]|jgi:hypothetical protein